MQHLAPRHGGSPRLLLLTLSLPILLPACPAARPDGGARPPARPEGDLVVETIPDPLYVAPLLTLSGELGQILYHLNIHNRGPRPATIRRIDLVALRGSEELGRETLAPPLLRRRLRPVAWIVMRDRLSIATAHRARGLLRRGKGDTVVPAHGAVALLQQLAIARPDQLPDTIRCTVVHDDGAAVHTFAVRTFSQRTRLRLPFEGRWWVMGGHHFHEQHAQSTLDSQNFAYDLGVLGEDASTCSGDRARNASYHANGRPILAAAAGTVVTVHDGVVENEPVGRRPVWSALIERPRDLAGNHVVLRHGDGEFSAYLHLRPGILVQEGAAVTAGQTIGLCGNSGNSLETHLHFQLQDGPDIFRAGGLPARFSDFTFHLGGLKLHVPPTRPLPLPARWIVEPGRAPGALEVTQVLQL